jgi:hypothetical protein
VSTSGGPAHYGPTRWSAASSRSPTRKKTLTYPACKDHVNEPAATNPAVKRAAGSPAASPAFPCGSRSFPETHRTVPETPHGS